ncbi:uncharacterized protein LOC135494463 [Lineus longissimus]|uniref:uncharacterized protein LOC135494463 n=1 Tax=Lineus longissimus TaxID=88925 RepID=UPI002B4DA0CC
MFYPKSTIQHNINVHQCTGRQMLASTFILFVLMSCASSAVENKVGHRPNMPISNKAKTEPLQCKTSKGGFEYAGYQNNTKTGKLCQAWVMKTPNDHTYKMENFPDESLQAAEYYCRNPNRDPHGPWCYLNKGKGSEYCDIPYCEGKQYRQECRQDLKGMEYRGTINTTMSGFTCQHWDAQKPHKHIYKDVNQFPENNLSLAENFCRNPDGESNGPWCFTTSFTRGWELCPIPFCFINECKKYFNGSRYAGKAHHTHTGKKCQRWDSQFPHKHHYTKNSMFPEATVSLAENYCRNPDPVAKPYGPWCYVTDIVGLGNSTQLFEYCEISLCDKTMEHWTGVFENHQKWVGKYLYNKKWRSFNFTVKGIKFPWEDQRGGVLIAKFDDGSSSFDVEGWMNEESNFMFHQIKQYVVTEWFMHGFFITGHLLYDHKKQTWQFQGIPRGGMMAINEFRMSPKDHLTIGIGTRPATHGHASHSVAGVAVGSTIGILVLIIIIALGILYARKKGRLSNKPYLIFHNPRGGVEDSERLSIELDLDSNDSSIELESNEHD